jgi:hypothetical protein
MSSVRRLATFARSLASLASLAGVLAIASSARATPNFPAAIQTYVGSADPPPCQICHVGPQQRGTVVTPFGVKMRARGLVEFDEASLKHALDIMTSDHVDSDGDGDNDIDALKAGRDPNEPFGGADGGTGGGGGGNGAAPIQPRYGCGAHVAPGARASEGASGAIYAAMLGAAIAISGCIRRARRRSRPRRSTD